MFRGPTTTSDETSTSSGSTGPGEVLPPVIADLMLTPTLLMSAGVVEVSVEVEDEGAEVVTTVDGGRGVQVHVERGDRSDRSS